MVSIQVCDVEVVKTWSWGSMMMRYGVDKSMMLRLSRPGSLMLRGSVICDALDLSRR